MSASKAISYAENTLGVHEIWQEVQSITALLAEARLRYDEAKHIKRQLEESIETLEMEIISEEWAKHPEMAQNRMDKHVKVAINQNSDHRTLRQRLMGEDQKLDRIEIAIRGYELDLKTRTARMEQLGGYLQYLAAVKLAAHAPILRVSFEAEKPTQTNTADTA